MADEGFAAARTIAFTGLATAQRHLGHLDDALANAERGRALAEASGFRIHAGESHSTRAEIHLARHRLRNTSMALDEARTDAEHALALQRRTGHRVGEIRTLVILDRVARAANPFTIATPHQHAALALCAELGLPARRFATSS